jgi:hypothetical protein
MPKQYKNVVDLVRDNTDDPTFADELEIQILKKQVREPLMLDIESIKANWENAVIVASRNHSIGPIVMESLDDVPVLIAELERLQAQAMAWEKACAILDGKSAPGI